MANLTREEAIAIYSKKGLPVNKYLFTVTFYENDNEVSDEGSEIVYGEQNAIELFLASLNAISYWAVKNNEYQEEYSDDNVLKQPGFYLNAVPTKTTITYRRPTDFVLETVVIIVKSID